LREEQAADPKKTQ